MSYLQSKRLVRSRYPRATCIGITVNEGCGKYDGIRLKTSYFINSEPFPGDGVGLSSANPDADDSMHNSKASAWIAAANLIQPPHAKPKLEIKAKSWPLRDHWVSKKIKREKARVRASRVTPKMMADMDRRFTKKVLGATE